MNGLSDNEIKSRENELYTKYYGDKCRVNENLLKPWTKKDEKEIHELSFREWVNSCLIYGCTYEFDRLRDYNYCVNNSTLGLYHVSYKRALKIIEEQKERFMSARVKTNVYTDCEGCTYNSCDWGD